MLHFQVENVASVYRSAARLVAGASSIRSGIMEARADISARFWSIVADIEHVATTRSFSVKTSTMNVEYLNSACSLERQSREQTIEWRFGIAGQAQSALLDCAHP